jgi:hypothetical protein
MKKYRIMVAIAALFLFSHTAWAAEQTKHDGHSSGGHEGMNMQQAPAQSPAKSTEVKTGDAAAHNMTPEEHKNMDMGGMNMSGDMPGMSHDGQAAGGGHNHGAEKEYVETPANAVVLGTFGAIMGAFILYGAITKLLRKKGRVQA